MAFLRRKKNGVNTPKAFWLFVKILHESQLPNRNVEFRFVIAILDFYFRLDQLKLLDMSGDIITLNVGGRLFTTSRMTLQSEPSSVLAKMFDNSHTFPPARIVDGAYFIDANPEVFEVILDYLRYKTLILPQKIPQQCVVVQARYFGLESLLCQLGDRLDNQVGGCEVSP